MDNNVAFLAGFILGSIFKLLVFVAEIYFIYELFQKDWSWNQDFIKQVVLVAIVGVFIWQSYWKK